MFYKAVILTLFAAIPTSETYTLPSYDFGNGSGASSSSSYQVKSSVGSPSGDGAGATYKLPAGIRASATAPTPPAPTLSNPADSYDQLKIVLNTAGFPSDTKYAIAISDDGFATTQYVQPDQTVGVGFTISNYQTYAAWGGAGGSLILGLQNGVTYTVKAAALQGAGTGSGFGPTATLATSVPSVTFGLSTSLTSTPPFVATFSSLPPGAVTAADATVSTSFTTNAKQGGAILVGDQQNGLRSPSRSYTLASAASDLTGAATGYGARITAAGQAGGGPLVPLSPYNGAGNNVGGLFTTLTPLASFAGPITTASLTFALMGKTDVTVPAAADYGDVLTLTATLSF